MKIVKGFDMTDPDDFMRASVLESIGRCLENMRCFVRERWDEEQMNAYDDLLDSYRTLMRLVTDERDSREYESPLSVYDARIR